MSENQDKIDEATSSAGHDPTLADLWQFAGNRLTSGEFNTAMVHLYRGEVARANTWRTRLDITTNWAVITAGAALTFTFGSIDNSPFILILDTILVMLFLFIEARRYRYYELWASRIRILEQSFFANLLAPPFLPRADWADRLTESLRNPRFPISLMEALGRRYRRNYAPIFLILGVSYLVKVAAFPTAVRDLAEFLERAALGPVPGWFVLGLGFVINGALVAIGVFTVGLRQATGEVLVDDEVSQLAAIGRRLQRATWEALETEVHLPSLPFLEKRKELAYIISDDFEKMSQVLLERLGRGVTLLHGTGMYTGQEHGVLMVVFNMSQIRLLKKLVYETDPKAFLIVTAVQEVRGLGFRPLEA